MTSYQKLKKQVNELEEKLERIRAIGTVFVPPNEWNSFKAGGPPDINDYEEVDLSTI